MSPYIAKVIIWFIFDDYEGTWWWFLSLHDRRAIISTSLMGFCRFQENTPEREGGGPIKTWLNWPNDNHHVKARHTLSPYPESSSWEMAVCPAEFSCPCTKEEWKLCFLTWRIDQNNMWPACELKLHMYFTISVWPTRHKGVWVISLQDKYRFTLFI